MCVTKWSASSQRTVSGPVREHGCSMAAVTGRTAQGLFHRRHTHLKAFLEFNWTTKNQRKAAIAVRSCKSLLSTCSLLSFSQIIFSQSVLYNIMCCVWLNPVCIILCEIIILQYTVYMYSVCHKSRQLMD